MAGVQDQHRTFEHPAGPRFRKFGPFGPAYEILSLGDNLAHIKVVESGEEFDYPTARLRDDPPA